VESLTLVGREPFDRRGQHLETSEFRTALRTALHVAGDGGRGIASLSVEIGAQQLRAGVVVHGFGHP
jgi:hypothetical protein